MDWVRQCGPSSLPGELGKGSGPHIRPPTPIPTLAASPPHPLLSTPLHASSPYTPHLRLPPPPPPHTLQEGRIIVGPRCEPGL